MKIRCLEKKLFIINYTISNFNVYVAISLHISGVVVFLSRPSRRLFVAFPKEDS